MKIAPVTRNLLRYSSITSATSDLTRQTRDICPLACITDQLINIPHRPPTGQAYVRAAGTHARSARLGSARLGSGRPGSARLGSARLGSGRLGSGRLGSAAAGASFAGGVGAGSGHGSHRQEVCWPSWYAGQRAIISGQPWNPASRRRPERVIPTNIIQGHQESGQRPTGWRRRFNVPEMSSSKHCLQRSIMSPHLCNPRRKHILSASYHRADNYHRSRDSIVPLRHWRPQVQLTASAAVYLYQFCVP